MVIESDGYHALIEFFSEHLALFQTNNATGEGTIEDAVTDMIANQLMMVCQQNPELDSEIRFKLMQEADAVMDDLKEVLASAWHSCPTDHQLRFLEEYIGLVKNLFDSAVS